MHLTAPCLRRRDCRILNDLSSSHWSHSSDMGIVQTSLRRIPWDLAVAVLDRGMSCSGLSLVVHMKSHSSPLTLSSRSMVLYHIDSPPRPPLRSPPNPCNSFLVVAKSEPALAPIPPGPPSLVRYVSRKASPETSQIRSHGS